MAEIEARRRRNAEDEIEVLATDINLMQEDAGHNPYDNPGRAKPLNAGTESAAGSIRRLHRARR